MNLVALLASIILVVLTLYWIFAQHLHGPLYIVAAVLSLVILLVMLVPYAPVRSQP